jgi:hypothetical protein
MKALVRYRWTLVALVAIVAVAAIRLLVTSNTVEHDGLTFAGPALARALESPSGASGTRVLERFDDADGIPCRAFLGSEVSGIACHERGGWHLRLMRDGVDLDDPGTLAATEQELRAAARQLEAQ